MLEYTRKILSLILILFVSNSFAVSQEKIRHWFLLAAAEDVRLYSKCAKARENLTSAGEDAVPFLISQLGRKDVRKALEAETALTRIGKVAVTELIEALADTDEDLASLAARILGDIGDKRALASLKVSARHGYLSLRASSCYALGRFDDTSSTTILIGALSDTISSVRRNAALSLSQLKNPRAVEPLFHLLSDSSYAVRYTAQNAIARIDTKKALEIALARLDSAKTPEKYHLIVLLGAIKDKDGIPTLEKLLQSTDPNIRGFACEALGYFRGNWQVANMLKRTLWDNSPFVKMKALNALGNIKKGSDNG